MPSLLKISQIILEKKVNVFSLFRYILPLKKGVAFHLKKNFNPLHQKMLLLSLVEIGPAVLENIFFLISSIYFRYFVISPWKKARSFILTKEVLC